MPSSLPHIRRKVDHKFGAPLLKKIRKFVVKNNPNLWGSKRSKDYITDCLYIALYKDAYGIGYDDITAQVHSSLEVSSKTVFINTQTLRELLCTWVKQQIKLGSSKQCIYDARNTPKADELAKVSLWMDSTDVPLIGKSSTSRRSNK